jgi:hypothetical protein
MNLSDIREKYLYCHQLLNPPPKKRRVIKRWTPTLTSEEKDLFDKEDILSSYQNIIANTCGRHQQVLLYYLIPKIFL